MGAGGKRSVEEPNELEPNGFGPPKNEATFALNGEGFSVMEVEVGGGIDTAAVPLKNWVGFTRARVESAAGARGGGGKTAAEELNKLEPDGDSIVWVMLNLVTLNIPVSHRELPFILSVTIKINTYLN